MYMWQKKGKKSKEERCLKSKQTTFRLTIELKLPNGDGGVKVVQWGDRGTIVVDMEW